MRASYCSSRLLRILSRSWLFFIAGLLAACGGGGGGGGSSSTPFVPTSSSSASSVSGSVIMSGKITYDFVPLTDNGLDYGATEARPVRGAVVEILGSANNILATTTTNDEGIYSLAVAQNTSVRVRTKAQLQRSLAPAWTMSVTDNTNNNLVYALDGSLANSGSSDSQRNLHAVSGWGGSSYNATRAAAPFAILDSAYVGLQRFVQAGQVVDFPPLEFRWSTKNNTAANPDDDFTTGEIGTSFFWGDAIYILGEVNSDTDEYDRHVILHEWGHYIEAALSRADTIGGSHINGERLDMRVAFSEGFGNAFSAMILDDPIYRDSNEFGQSGIFAIDVSETNNVNEGWYSEASVHSVLYHYYISENNKTARDFAPIIKVFTDVDYIQSDYLTSIFLFAERLVALFPGHTDLLESLLEAQNINTTAADAAGESNDAGYADVFPVYKNISADGSLANVCSSSRFGSYNKLGVSQFLQLDIQSAGFYTIAVSRSPGTTLVTDPDFSLFHRGQQQVHADGEQDNFEGKSANLSPGKYILEVYDWHNRDPDNQANNTTCFNVQVSL